MWEYGICCNSESDDDYEPLISLENWTIINNDFEIDCESYNSTVNDNYYLNKGVKNLINYGNVYKVSYVLMLYFVCQ